MNRSFRPMLALLLALAVLGCAAVLLMPEPTVDESPAQDAGAAENITPKEGCELLQTLSYTRCGHNVVRRVTAPVEVYGKTLANIEAMYPEWRITEYAAAMIKMEQQLEIYCPDHMVLMPDAAGMLCVFQNKYGEALAVVRELGIAVKELPAAAREDVETGLGFDNAEALEQWLESMES